GSGKSTLINLLLRLYDPNSGSIFIDNQDIKESYLRSVRDNIAIVTQEVAIFDDTVENNIAYGNLRASVDEITQAAENALVTDFCSLDAQIGQGGNKLSGGQRQRIAIARALLKNAAIMILDEATSSLDNIVEAKIMENIKRIRRGKTNLIIAHRLSTIIDADLIYVMQHGKIVESGTHEDLMKKEGYYYKLYLRGEE
ncbi:MAG: ATP-binding cassette domain-containing protein, partial [Alphaproteobacteria bacterium]|nr:ATP-binding cassette domain-containing protein [Alphaproteobacteria bacterium]